MNSMLQRGISQTQTPIPMFKRQINKLHKRFLVKQMFLLDLLVKLKKS